MDRTWLVEALQHVPQGALSRAWGWLARRKKPRLGVKLLKRAFVRAAGIDMREAQDPIDSFETLEELFVRRLRPGVHRIDPQPDAVVSPVDGMVGMSGKISSGTLMQVKGRSYSVASLLDDEHEAQRYASGVYATVYLAPRDYHRIHAPVAGQVRDAVLIPGYLLPVFQESVQRVDELFARNERIITYIDTPDHGRVALVKVGATLVGRISVVYDATLATNQVGQLKRRLHYDPPHVTNKGAELAAFELGSTVVILAESNRLKFSLSEGQKVRVGQKIGALVDMRKKAAISTAGESVPSGPN